MNTLDTQLNIALEASAGTGKTFQLAMRAVALLLQNVPPKDILCLTFTNKATDEMLERILEILDILAGNDSNEKFQLFYSTLEPIIIKHAQKNTQEFTNDFISKLAKRTRDNLLEEFSNLKVKTNDAFFNNILKMFPFEAELRPNFKIISDNEIKNIKNEAFLFMLEELLKDDDWNKILKTFIKANEILPTNMLDSLKEYSSYVSDRWLQLHQTISDMALSKTYLKNILDEQVKLYNDTFQVFNDFLKTFDNSTFNGNQIKIFNNLNNILQIKDIYKSTFFQKELGEHSWFGKYTFTPSHYNQFDEIRKNIKEYLTKKSLTMKALVYILGDKLYLFESDVKNKQNALTYSDIQTKVYEILSGSKPKINSDYLYYRLDGKINHILLDEFQDTSTAQWLILKPLIIEAMAGVGQYDKVGSFFYVGDPKQNIYRFRGGSSSLFLTVANTYSNKIEKRTLDTNFRSDSAIVEVVNELFNSIANSFPQNELSIFKIDQKPRDNAKKGYVEIENDEDFEQYAVKKVKWLKENGREYGEIAILASSNDDCIAIKVALEKEGAPVKLETSGKLINSASYRSIISLICMVYTDNDIFFTEYALTEPQVISAKNYGLSENRFKYINTIKKVAFDIEDETILEKLIRLFKFTNMDKRFQNEPDFIQTLDIIAENLYNEKNFKVFIKKLDEFSGSIATLSTASSDSIIVMTIHKSKGLQFPIVILPNLDIEFKTNSRRTPFITVESNDIGLSQIGYVHSKDAMFFLDDAEKEALQIENNLVLQDALNNLYVATTRAENTLMINVKHRNDKKEPLNIAELIPLHIADTKYGELNLDKPKLKKTSEHELHFKISNFKSLLKTFPELEQQEDYVSATFGTFLHEAAFRLNGFTDVDAENAINLTLSKFGATLQDGEKELATLYIKELVNSKDYQYLFNGKVFKERRLSNKQKLIQIDLYSIFEDHIVLIDYKTGLITDEKNDDYKKQLFAYSTVLKDIYNLNIKKFLYNFNDSNLNIIKY